MPNPWKKQLCTVGFKGVEQDFSFFCFLDQGTVIDWGQKNRHHTSARISPKLHRILLHTGILHKETPGATQEERLIDDGVLSWKVTFPENLDWFFDTKPYVFTMYLLLILPFLFHRMVCVSNSSRKSSSLKLIVLTKKRPYGCSETILRGSSHHL